MQQEQIGGLAELPRGYRVKVAALAVFGDLAWRVAVLLPWAFMTGLGLLWWNQTWAWIVFGIALMFFWWLISPSHEPLGRPIDMDHAQGLLAELAHLRTTLRTPAVHRIVLVDDLNAGAAQQGVSWWPWGQRNTLVLGVPLLAMLSPVQARAVIAHELGHFSRQHGLLGHWVYRARLGWLSLIGPAQEADSAFDRLVTWFAKAFIPFFSAYAFALARYCEFEADRDAAHVTSAADLASALALMHMAQQRLDQWLQRDLVLMKLGEPRAPSDWWHRMQSALLMPPYCASQLAQVLSQQPEASDTHPILVLRVAALGVDPSAIAIDPVQADACAGRVWFSNWSQTMVEANRVWEQAQQRAWRVEHVMLKAYVERAGQLATSGELTVEHVRVLSALGRTEDALAVADAMLALGNVSPAVKATTGLLWLTHRIDRADEAMQLLDQAVAADHAWAYPARRAALAAAQRLHYDEQIERLQALLARALTRRSQATDAVHHCIERSQLRASRMSPLLLYAIDALCDAESMVHEAWIGSCEVSAADRRTFDAHALVLRVDPDALRDAGDDEDNICEGFTLALRHACANEAEILVVRISYTTETHLPQLLAQSEARHWFRTD